MIFGRLTLAFALLLPASAWAQFGKDDIMKLAGSQTDSIIKALKLSPQQVNMVKPLLQSKLKDISGVKKKLTNSDQSDAAKKEAADSLKAIDSKYDSKITAALNPDQIKTWNDLKKGLSSMGANLPK